jgi:hypothetical protein
VSDSTKEAEDMVRRWTESQTKAWESWLDTLRTFQGFPASEAWQKNLEAFRDAMTKALDAQADGARMWAETLARWSGEVQESTRRQKGLDGEAEGTRIWGESLTAWARQVEETTRSWTEAQKQLWQGWYETMRRLDPSRPAQLGSEEGRDLLQVWQESVRKTLEAQAEWSRTWLAGQQRASRRGRQSSGS